MGKNNKLNVEFYRWRIEFRLRGAAHVHGVLWLNFDLIEKIKSIDNELVYPDIKNGVVNLQHSRSLSCIQMGSVIKFIDDICTCSRQNNASKIVESVNWHHHTKSCRKKKSTHCRFHYPKFPSERNILTQPISESTDSTIVNQAKRNLLLVKRVLCSLPDSQQKLDRFILENSVNLDWILNKASVKKMIIIKLYRCLLVEM